MHSENLSWAGKGWLRGAEALSAADVVLYFGARAMLADGTAYGRLLDIFPGAILLGCSSGGQIQHDEVGDDKVLAIALKFSDTKVKLARCTISANDQSMSCGVQIGRELAGEGLAAIFALSDGLTVNGSELVAGITQTAGRDVKVTGGLAGDGADFDQTLVGANEAPRTGVVGAIGFYGHSVRIGTGSAGGWDVFGPKRSISHSSGNVLHTLDGQPALDLYERYLGPEDGKALPGSGLLFPLKISDPSQPNRAIVRTILSIDREKRSMTFAGDMPQGWQAQLMRGKHDRLIDGAAEAARRAGAGGQNGVAILVSCIGRRLLMGQRVVDEVNAAAEVLGQALPLIGFYSYGEISPQAETGFCELHNQTMTITTIAEAA